MEAFARACDRQGRDPASIRRSVLLDFGRVLPTTSADSYLDPAERAAAMGFDELIVYGSPWADGEPRDLEVHEQALARLR